MKQLFSIVLSVFLFSSLGAQKIGFWFDAGLKAGVGPSLLYNQNIFDDDTYDHQLSTGYGVGAKLGIFYGLYNGVNFDIMLNQGVQKFRSEVTSTFTDHKVSWTSTDIAVLYRLQKEGIYVELGPMFSLINKVEQEGFGPADVSQYYSETNTSGVFGFGGYLLGGGQFTLMFGIRAGYSFTDFINDEGQALQYPRASVSVGDLTAYDSYKSTNPLFLQFMLEANFGLGYFAKTACSNRTAFFRFD